MGKGNKWRACIEFIAFWITGSCITVSVPPPKSVQALEQLSSLCISQGKHKWQGGFPDTYVLYVGRGTVDLVWV